MKCKYCNKDWCWLCQKIFTSTEEHYGNINSPCFNRMNDVNEVNICSKCDNEINNIGFWTFSCDHTICNKCYEEYLLQNRAMILFPEKIINCIISGCHGFINTKALTLMDLINETKNEKLITKYKASFLFYEYFIVPFFPVHFCKYYIEILFSLYEIIAGLFSCFKVYDKFYYVLEIIGFIFAIIFIPIYVIIVPIFIHILIKRLYFAKFMPEIEKKFNNKIIYLLLILGEEILSLIFLFSLMAFHYIYVILLHPLFGLILLIRMCLYNL